MPLKSISLSYLKEPLSTHAFIQLVHRRIKREIRNNQWFTPGETLHLLDDGSVTYAVGKHLLEELFPKNLTLVSVKKLSKQKNIIPSSLEHTVKHTFHAILDNKPMLKTEKNKIPLLGCLLEEEIHAYAVLHGIPVPAQKEIPLPIVDAMQKKHTETKFSLRKSFQNLQR